MAFCSNCGTKAPDGVKFCPECGTRIMTAAQMNAAAAPAPVVKQPAPAPVVEQPAPAPVVEQPAPAPVVEQPAPAPVVEKPAPAPVVEQPAPAPVVEKPAPAPVVEKPAPAPVVERPAPAPVVEQPAPAAKKPAAKFEVGEDGLEYVPYVPVANPQIASSPVAKKPAAKKPVTAPATVPEVAAPAVPVEPEVVEAPKPAKAPKAPKKGIAKFLPFIIGGAVVALAALIGIIVLVVNLVKGGSGMVDENADPNLGLYNAVTAEMMGFEMGVEDLWANGFSIELKEKGKAALNIDGTKGNAKWSLEDGVFNVKGGGLDCSGTLANGELVLENVLDMGVTLTFEKEGGFAGATDDPDDPGVPGDTTEPSDVDVALTPIQEQWNGMWFGCVRFMECTGKYVNYDYMNMDAFINIDVDGNGNGTMNVYMGQDAGLPAFATANIKAADYGIDTNSGKVLSFDMNTSSWMFRPTPDYEDRYVVYDTVEDGDGDHFEYMVFMKKWGNTWQPEIDTDFEIVPDSAAYYEECIAGGAAAPVISDNTALASSLEEATGSQLNLDGASAPAGDAGVTSEITLPSTWYGWVVLSDWWGDGEGEPMYDAWAFVDQDSEGRPFVDIKLDGYPDSAFMSMYMHLDYDNTMIVPEFGDNDAWFNDTYLVTGEEDNYCMYLMEDGTLCAGFTYVSYTGEYGCEVAMCFRPDGALWDEENDLLPLRYDEYKAALGAATEGAPVEDEPVVSGGDGIMEFDALKAGFKQVYDNGSGSTYAEIRDMFGGVDGKPKTIEDDFHSYRWATEDDKSYVLVSFKVDETGLEKYSGVSWSSDLKD